MDLTFGIVGKGAANRYDDRAYAAAIQADGKIVVAGTRAVNYETALLARYNTDGSLDQNFGIGGFVNDSAHGGHRTYFTAVAVQADGKIVAAGYFYEFAGCPGYRTTVFRYNADGSRDTTFDSDGTLEIGFISINGCRRSYASVLAIRSTANRCRRSSSTAADSRFFRGASHKRVVDRVLVSRVGQFQSASKRSLSSPASTREENSRREQLQHRDKQQFCACAAYHNGSLPFRKRRQ